MPRFKEQAICIRHLDWSETSQIVVLLTQGRGKVRGLAKGSRRSSPSAVARFSGGIELLTLGQVVAATKPSSELATITEWDLQQPFHHLRTDLNAQRLAMYAADIAHAMLADDDAHPVCFHALAELLAELKDARGQQQALLCYQWALLMDCGYRPQLDVDAHSGLPLSPTHAYVFDARAGGLTDGGSATDPGRANKDIWRVRPETIALLRDVREGRSIADAPQDVLRRANQLMCVNLRAILDRQLPTMGFLLGSRY